MILFLGRENLLEPGEDLEGVLGVGGHQVERPDDGPGLGSGWDVLGEALQTHELDVDEKEDEENSDQH